MVVVKCCNQQTLTDLGRYATVGLSEDGRFDVLDSGVILSEMRDRIRGNSKLLYRKFGMTNEYYGRKY